MPTANRTNTGLSERIRALPASIRLAPSIAAAVFALFLWLGEPLSELLTGQDPVLARIERSGVMRVGMDANYPPFEWVDAQGQFQGYDVDLARALGEQLGVQVTLVDVHFDGLYDALEAQRCDLIISALPHDPMMTRDLAYSRAYYDAGLVLVGSSGGADIETIEDLAGRSVAVELGSEGHMLARLWERDKGLAIELHVVREPQELVASLQDSSTELLICDSVTARGYLAQDPSLRIVGPMLSSERYVIAAPIEATELIDRVDQALDEWEASGQLGAWEQRWLSERASP